MHSGDNANHALIHVLHKALALVPLGLMLYVPIGHDLYVLHVAMQDFILFTEKRLTLTNHSAV